MMKPILMVVWPGMEKIRFGLRDAVVVRFEASRDYNDLLNQIDEGLVGAAPEPDAVAPSTAAPSPAAPAAGRGAAAAARSRRPPFP